MSKTATLPQTRDPFQNLFTRLFGDSLAEFYGTDTPTSSNPRTNISETDKAYELSFELPGVIEQDIHVQLHDKTLTITAERKDDRSDDDKKKRWHRVEHRYGRYSRAIALPQDAAADGIEAVYKNGVLHVVVPKQPEAQPARIAVRTA